MKRLLIIVNILVALSVLITPLHRDLAVGDETKYSQIVREMRESGSLLVPRLNGEPYTHKPPLHFWIITALTYVFGYQSIWPFILQSLLAHFLTLLLVYAVAKRMFGETAALLAPIFFGTAYLAWGIAQTARMDPAYVLLITYALIHIYRFLTTSATRSLLIAAAAIGVAILIKGPMALVMVALVFLFERIRGRRIPRTKAYWTALLILAVIPLVWLIPALIEGGAAYADELLVKQNIGRAVNSFVHKQPVWYYVVSSPVIFFPLMFVAIPAFIAIYRRDHWTNEEADFLRYCVSWILAVIIPFSLLSGKLPVYMLPAIFPMALIVSRFVTSPGETRLQRRAWAAVCVVMAFFVVLLAGGPFVGDRFLKGDPEDALLRSAAVKVVLWASAGIGALLLLFAARGGENRLVRSAVALSLFALVPFVGMAAFLMPLFNELSSAQPMVRAIERQKVDPEKVALYFSPHIWSSSMDPAMFKVRHIGPDGLKPQHGPLPEVVVTRASRQGELGPELPANYEKVDEFRVIRKQFDVFRKR